jgi:hypothetical protein
MKRAIAGFVLITAALFAQGCASDPDRQFRESMLSLPAIEPPAFMTADVAALFGTANFSARVEARKGIAGTHPPMFGELSGSGGSLLFVSEEKRARREMAVGLSALWHAPSQTAYLLNEPLQAYAPMRNSVTNGPTEVSVLGEEEVNGERCRKSVVMRQGTPVLVVWRALAKQELPVRIQMTNGPAAATLNLSRVRMQAQPPELFALPNGFKAYPSTEALLTELMRRRTEAIDASYRSKRERTGVVTPGEFERVQPPQKVY